MTTGTISVAAGTYVERDMLAQSWGESRWCRLATTVIRAASEAVTPLIKVANSTGATISDIQLDGQARTTSDYGLRMDNVSKFTVTRIISKGFKGPVGSHGRCGHGRRVRPTSSSPTPTFLNSGGCFASYQTRSVVNTVECAARENIHHNTFSNDTGLRLRGIGLRAAGSVTDFGDPRQHFHRRPAGQCSQWDTLGVEFWGNVNKSD